MIRPDSYMAVFVFLYMAVFASLSAGEKSTFADHFPSLYDPIVEKDQWLTVVKGNGASAVFADYGLLKAEQVEGDGSCEVFLSLKAFLQEFAGIRMLIKGFDGGWNTNVEPITPGAVCVMNRSPIKCAFWKALPPVANDGIEVI